jgi:hypothetical protein
LEQEVTSNRKMNKSNKQSQNEHKVTSNQFVNKHGGSTYPKEEQNIFIREHKELLIAEWSHMSWNPKPLDTQ